jgi:outer membrane lipoprotein-sorting protein
MNLFSKIAIGVPALMFATAAFAQPTDPNYDPKAKVILDDVSKTAKGYSTITATFTITIKHPDGSADVKNGTAVLKGSKYKVILENKVKDVIYKEEYYNDGTKTYVFTEKNGELTIDKAPDPNATRSENSISPSSLFSAWDKGFKYKFIKEEVKDGRTYQYIELYPEKPDKKNYTMVQLTIDKAKKQITSITLKMKDGSTTVYAIKTFTPNLEVTDATFKFDEKAHKVKTRVDLTED